MGAVPAELGTLPSLKTLDLTGNRLTGTPLSTLDRRLWLKHDPNRRIG